MVPEELTKHLKRWESRRRLADAVLWTPRGLLLGLLAAATVAAIARFRPLVTAIELAYLTIGLATAGTLVAAAAALGRRRSAASQARFADQRFGLLERVATALEIHDGRLQVLPGLAGLQLADTLTVARAVDVKAAVPVRPDRQNIAIIILALGLLIAAILVPNPQDAILERQRAIEAGIEEQVAALEALAEEIEENPELAEEAREELLMPIESALEELESGALSQEEAVAVLSEAEAQLRELGRTNDTEALQLALEEAASPLLETPAGQPLGQALESANLSAASQAANDLADQVSNLSAEEQSALAEQLAETAEALQATDSELAGELAEAAQALEEGDSGAAESALRDAAGTLQQRAQEQAAAQQAESAAGQLNQGRGELAQAGQSGSPQGQGQAGADGQPGQGQGQQGQGQQGQQGQGTPTDQGEGVGGPGPGGGHAERVYVPEAVDLSAEPGVDVQLPAECIADPDSCGPLITERLTQFEDERSLVPYSQVFGDYRDAAYASLEDDYVPLALRGYVRDYFSSLEP